MWLSIGSCSFRLGRAWGGLGPDQVATETGRARAAGGNPLPSSSRAPADTASGASYAACQERQDERIPLLTVPRVTVEVQRCEAHRPVFRSNRPPPAPHQRQWKAFSLADPFIDRRPRGGIGPHVQCLPVSVGLRRYSGLDVVVNVAREIPRVLQMPRWSCCGHRRGPGPLPRSCATRKAVAGHPASLTLEQELSLP